MNMDPQERERYLQLGRKMLEEKLGNIRKTNLPQSASLPTVSEDYNSQYSPSSLPGTPTKLSGPLSTDKYPSPITIPTRTPSGGLFGNPNYLNSSFGSIGTPQSPSVDAFSDSALNYQSPRDQNSHNRLNELTRERAELSAELFKQKKTCEDLTNQNNQLRQRIANFEKVLNQNQQFEDKIISLESENSRISELLKAELSKNENIQENYEKQQQIIQNLSSEKSLLEQQLLEKVNTFQLTHDESKDHQKQLEEKNQHLQNEILKLQENQRKIVEKSDEIQSKNEKLTGDLKEKEQQLSIIYKESEERQKVYQNTISLFNEKNQVIQQLNTQIEQLKNEVSTSLTARNQLQVQFDQFKVEAQLLAENKQQTIYQLQEKIEAQDKRMKEIEAEKSNSRAVQDIIDNKVATMNQLQDKIQSLANENEKLKQTITSYTEIMENLQQTHSQIVETYEFKLREFSLRHQEEIKSHLNLINQLQSQLQKSATPPSSAPISSPSLDSIRAELKLLNDVRETHKAIKQNPDLPIEELQEIKIQELLEEISIMDGLLNKVPFVSAAPAGPSPPELLERIEYLEKELNSRSNSLSSAQQEVSALLLAIETGDLTAYSQLKMQQHQQQQQVPPPVPDSLPEPSTGDAERKLEIPVPSDPVPELVSVEEPSKPATAAPNTPSKKRFWFW